MSLLNYFSIKKILPSIAVLVGLLFFSILPFYGVLEIYHVFSEVDHTGHEHSEFDLCQWVQQHANGLFVFENLLADGLPFAAFENTVARNIVVASILGFSVQSPRPPPVS